jgi:hypothetical protein
VAAPTPRLTYRFFFTPPPFERRTFFKHLLCHIAAVLVWTGMWDLTDAYVLPAISDSCLLTPGLLAEFPCVLFKFSFIVVGAAGLHWTGQLYYGLDEDVYMPDEPHSARDAQRAPSRHPSLRLPSARIAPATGGALGARLSTALRGRGGVKVAKSGVPSAVIGRMRYKRVLTLGMLGNKTLLVTKASGRARSAAVGGATGGARARSGDKVI